MSVVIIIESVCESFCSRIRLDHDPAWPDDELMRLWKEGVERYREQCDRTDDEWEKMETSPHCS